MEKMFSSVFKLVDNQNNVKSRRASKAFSIADRVCCFQFVCSTYKSLPNVNKPTNHFNKVFNLHEQISFCS